MKETQKSFIEKRLRTEGHITRNVAIRNYISRLASIICGLEKDGYVFKTEYVPTINRWGKCRDYKYTVVSMPTNPVNY